jgi:hypothetical protein
MKKIVLVGLFILGFTSFIRAQEVAINLGYQESEDFGIFVSGVTAGNIDMTFIIGSPDLGDDSNFLVGGRIGYMFYLYEDNGTSLYAGPHLGGYFLERSTLDNNFNYSDETETSLNYGVTAGIYFAPINIAFDYGIDDLFESEYIAFKIGFDIFGYM